MISRYIKLIFPTIKISALTFFLLCFSLFLIDDSGGIIGVAVPLFLGIFVILSINSAKKYTSQYQLNFFKSLVVIMFPMLLLLVLVYFSIVYQNAGYTGEWQWNIFSK